MDMISGDRWMISDTKGFTKNTSLYFVNTIISVLILGTVWREKLLRRKIGCFILQVLSEMGW